MVQSSGQVKDGSVGRASVGMAGSPGGNAGSVIVGIGTTKPRSIEIDMVGSASVGIAGRPGGKAGKVIVGIGTSNPRSIEMEIVGSASVGIAGKPGGNAGSSGIPNVQRLKD
jgi:hypothetical protein